MIAILQEASCVPTDGAGESRLWQFADTSCESLSEPVLSSPFFFHLPALQVS